MISLNHGESSGDGEEGQGEGMLSGRYHQTDGMSA